MKNAKVPCNLFKPGAGGIPPHLAGRDDDLKKLAPLENSLREGGAPSRDVVLYGPRGNGKTVLMHAFLQQVSDAKRLQALNLTPDEIPNIASLCSVLDRKKPLRRLWKRLQEIREIKGNINVEGTVDPAGNVSRVGLGAGGGIAFGNMQDAAEAQLLREVMEARLQKGPMVLALDEAHVLGSQLGQSLLNAVQKMRSENRPIMLLLAGTPGLKKNLGDMNATFWDRCRKIPVGLLHDSDSAAALTEPLKDYGVQFDADALQAVVLASSGYPFFLQLLGEAITQELAERQRITVDHVADALPSFEEEKNLYYLDRHNELRSRGLLLAAEALAGIYASSDNVDEDTILKALRSCTVDQPDKGKETLDSLVQLGYVWQDETGNYVPGTPSLMDYVGTYIHNSTAFAATFGISR